MGILDFQISKNLSDAAEDTVNFAKEIAKTRRIPVNDLIATVVWKTLNVPTVAPGNALLKKVSQTPVVVPKPSGLVENKSTNTGANVKPLSKVVKGGKTLTKLVVNKAKQNVVTKVPEVIEIDDDDEDEDWEPPKQTSKLTKKSKVTESKKDKVSEIKIEKEDGSVQILKRNVSLDEERDEDYFDMDCEEINEEQSNEEELSDDDNLDALDLKGLIDKPEKDKKAWTEEKVVTVISDDDEEDEDLGKTRMLRLKVDLRKSTKAADTKQAKRKASGETIEDSHSISDPETIEAESMPARALGLVPAHGKDGELPSTVVDISDLAVLAELTDDKVEEIDEEDTDNSQDGPTRKRQRLLDFDKKWHSEPKYNPEQDKASSKKGRGKRGGAKKKMSKRSTGATKRKRRSKVNEEAEMNMESEKANDIKEEAGKEDEGELKPGTKGPYPCPHCPKVFNFKDSLPRHLKLHDNKDKVRCGRCLHFFNNIDELKEHRKTAHVKDIVCVYCGKMFNRNYTLNHHLICVHKVDPQCDVSIFECEFCGQRFTKQGVYNDHLHRHLGVEQYQCGKCGKPFYNRYVHSKHEGKCTGIRFYKCGHCGKQCQNMAAMSKHISCKHFSGDVQLNVNI